MADVPAALVEVTGDGPAGKPGVEHPLNEAGGCGLAGSEESLDLVAGEKARMQADQGDPLGLSRSEAHRFQQSFPSLQVGDQGFTDLAHGVSMPAASSLLRAISRSKRAVVLVLFRA